MNVRKRLDNDGRVRGDLTSQTGVVELHIPQAGIVQHLKFILVNLGDVLEVFCVVGISILGVGTTLLVAHVEPCGCDHCELDVTPLALGHECLDQLELVKVGCRLLLVVGQLGASDDGVTGHDLAVLLDETDDIRVVEAEHGGFGILETEGALELVPHQAPEACAIVFAAGDCLEAQILLQLDYMSNRFLLNLWEIGRLWADALVTDSFTSVEELLWPQERAHVLCAEGWHCGERIRRDEMCEIENWNWNWNKRDPSVNNGIEGWRQEEKAKRFLRIK